MRPSPPISTAAAAPATPAPRILVVNSDATVGKYADVQNAFIATLGTPVQTVDLRTAAETQLRRAILADNPSLIHCIGAAAYTAVQRLARDKPIVLSSAINWERLSPGRQTRVIANELPAGSQLTLFRNFFPRLQRVGVVYSREINRQWFEQAAAAGREVGLEVIGRTVSRSREVAAVLAELTPRADALWLVPDPIVLEDLAAVRLYFDRAEAGGKPVFAYSPAFGEFAATLILSPDTPTIGRQAAGLAQDFARAPALSTPAGSEVTLNLRRVQQFGLELNRDALDSVNELIR